MAYGKDEDSIRGGASFLDYLRVPGSGQLTLTGDDLPIGPTIKAAETAAEPASGSVIRLAAAAPAADTVSGDTVQAGTPASLRLPDTGTTPLLPLLPFGSTDLPLPSFASPVEPFRLMPPADARPSVGPTREAAAAMNAESLTTLLGSLEQLIDQNAGNDKAALEALLKSAEASGATIPDEIKNAITEMGDKSFLTTRASVEATTAAYASIKALIESSERATPNDPQSPLLLDQQKIQEIGASLLKGLQPGSIVVDKPNVVDDVPAPDPNARAAALESGKQLKEQITR